MTAAPHTAVLEQAKALVAAVDEVDDAERAFDQQVRSAFGVNNTDFSVLHFVDREQRRGGTVRVGDIAVRFGVSSGSATEIVHRLTESGLVHRVPHPTDARVRRLELTEDASTRFAELLGPVRTELDALLATIPDADQMRMVQLLALVRDIFRRTGDA